MSQENLIKSLHQDVETLKTAIKNGPGRSYHVVHFFHYPRKEALVEP